MNLKKKTREKRTNEIERIKKEQTRKNERTGTNKE